MEQPSNITKIEKYDLRGTAYLVRGIGKRAIRVIIKPFPFTTQDIDTLELLLLAAKRAVHNGDKTVYVFPDCTDGEEAHIENHSQYYSKQHCFYFNTYLTYYGESDYHRRYG